MTDRARTALAASFLALVSLTACNKGAPDSGKAVAAAPPETPYTAVVNGKADVEGGIISVAARRSGIVRDVYVQEGDTVTKGQILARQEDDEPRLAAARVRAQVAQTKAQITSTEVQIAAAKRELARLETLADAKFTPAQKVDQARDQVLQLEAVLAAQKAAVAVSEAAANEAAYNLELTIIRAPVDGRIIRRLANPGAGASTLNVSNMFDIEPKAARIVRAEIPESVLPVVVIGQAVQIVPEADSTKAYPGTVLRRAGLFGSRKLQTDDPTERTDERVVEVVVSADSAPLLIGQRVLVKFMKGSAPALVVAK